MKTRGKRTRATKPKHSAEIYKHRIYKAVKLITEYGSIDGEHHKQWVLDQVVRTLLDKGDYRGWRKAFVKEPLEDGERWEDWDEGIAP